MEDFHYQPNMSVVRSARMFVRSLCEVYGTEKGMAVWDHIREGLGDQIAGDIFLGMLVGPQGDLRVVTMGPMLINAIKEVRAFTGWGLKEAKDFCEAVRDRGPQPIDASQFDEDKIDQFIRAMGSIGCKVE